jgi:4'-phosphopantetheinyl transferase
MTLVYWLEQTQADVPADNDWLSPSESIRLSNLRFPKRRADWRLGRWTAKLALAAYLSLPDDHQTLAEIQIRAAPSGAPEVFLNSRPSPTSISLSHCSGHALCTLVRSPVALGCDLEWIEPRSGAFVADYFTAEEQALVAQSSAADLPLLLTLLWSGKESALKARHVGLQVDARSVIVRPGNVAYGVERWHPLRAYYVDDQVFQGWWQHTDNFLRTLVSAPPPDPPVNLRSPSLSQAPVQQDSFA